MASQQYSCAFARYSALVRSVGKCHWFPVRDGKINWVGVYVPTGDGSEIRRSPPGDVKHPVNSGAY